MPQAPPLLDALPCPHSPLTSQHLACSRRPAAVRCCQELQRCSSSSELRIWRVSPCRFWKTMLRTVAAPLLPPLLSPLSPPLLPGLAFLEAKGLGCCGGGMRPLRVSTAAAASAGSRWR